MTDLLVRNLDQGTKSALATRAAENGRSQQAEARAILESTLRHNSSSWVARLRSAAQAADGIEMPLPERHAPRTVETEDWQ